VNRFAAAVACALTVAMATTGATQAFDQLATPQGPITITPLNHATLELALGSTVVLVDPTEQAKYDGLPTPSIILVTDIHGDHLSPKTVARLQGPKTTVIAPAAAVAQLADATAMANGQSSTVAGVDVEAVPMYNIERGPAAGQFYHTKGRGNGYVVTLGGKRIYIAGDTECTPEMKALKNIDVAFVPMNLPYTMTPGEAAACVAAFKPAVVYPYHSRGSKVQEFADALKGTGVDVRLRDWYAQ
jgi:L-ascorbate metabolism protein UlaG (beta-lactamase superfamily)